MFIDPYDAFLLIKTFELQSYCFDVPFAFIPVSYLGISCLSQEAPLPKSLYITMPQQNINA